MAMVGGSIMRIVSSIDWVTVAGPVDAVGDVQTFNAWKIQAELGRVPMMSTDDGLMVNADLVKRGRVVPGRFRVSCWASCRDSMIV